MSIRTERQRALDDLAEARAQLKQVQDLFREESMHVLVTYAECFPSYVYTSTQQVMSIFKEEVLGLRAALAALGQPPQEDV